MKKNSIIILFILLFVKLGIAQNLVPNPSFENYVICPITGGQLDLAFPWINPCNVPATPDYFNQCDTLGYPNNVGVPGNGFGNEPAKTGAAYAGFYTMNLPWINAREYIEAPLNDTLKAGKKYIVSFYVSLADLMGYATNNIGVYFSDIAIINSLDTLLPFIPQIQNTSSNLLTNKNGWSLVQDTLTAIGGEKHMIIGNFNSLFQSDTVYVGCGTWGDTCCSYYYIDDVSVYPCDAPVFVADAGSNQTICIGKTDSVQIGTTAQNEYIYWWTPTTGLSNGNIANPKASPAVTTTYYLHQKDFKFDETVDSVTVVVEDCPVNNLIIVNAFTPNADGVNDVFHIKGTNIKTLHAKIINRWGQVLFEWNDLNAGWDGRYKGIGVGAGAYFYVVTVVYEDGTIEEKKGAIELIR